MNFMTSLSAMPQAFRNARIPGFRVAVAMASVAETSESDPSPTCGPTKRSADSCWALSPVRWLM